MADNEIITTGFEATVLACKKLGLDIETVPKVVLQIFYNSGMAFADHPDAFTKEQRQQWRDSVIWPRVIEPAKPRLGRPPKAD
jgi:hypothetical protein